MKQPRAFRTDRANRGNLIDEAGQFGTVSAASLSLLKRGSTNAEASPRQHFHIDVLPVGTAEDPASGTFRRAIPPRMSVPLAHRVPDCTGRWHLAPAGFDLYWICTRCNAMGSDSTLNFETAIAENEAGRWLDELSAAGRRMLDPDDRGR